MAVAIIGGTITSTFLTLLVIPSFYDSIENARDGALAKFQARVLRWNPLAAFVVTAAEALAALLMLRLVWRLLGRALGWLRRRGAGRKARAA
jgi:HAE1 family hydrophobic/amphiphilic exporter-1